jgi:hypothetical protein
VAVEEGEQRRGREGERIWFDAEGDHRRKSKWRSKRGSIRFGDGGSSDGRSDNDNEVIRAGGARGGS